MSSLRFAFLVLFLSLLGCELDNTGPKDKGTLPQDLMPFEAGLKWRYQIVREYSRKVPNQDEMVGRDSGEYSITLLAVTSVSIGLRFQERIYRSYPAPGPGIDSLVTDVEYAIERNDSAIGSLIQYAASRVNPTPFGSSFMSPGNWKPNPGISYETENSKTVLFQGESRKVVSVQFDHENDPLDAFYRRHQGSAAFLAGVGFFTYRYDYQDSAIVSRETDSLLEFSRPYSVVIPGSDNRLRFSSLAEGNSWRFDFKRRVASEVTTMAWTDLLDSGEVLISIPHAGPESVMVNLHSRFHRKHVPSPGDMDVESDTTVSAANNPDSIEAVVTAVGKKQRIASDPYTELTGPVNWRTAPPANLDNTTILQDGNGKKTLYCFLPSRNPLGVQQSAPAIGLARFEEGVGMTSYSCRFQGFASFNEEMDTLTEFKRL